MKIILILVFLIASCMTLGKTIAGKALTLYIENDTRDIGGPGSDNAYSNGIKISYISAENKIPIWAKPAIKEFDIIKQTVEETQSNFGISIGQQIYTPNDIRNPELIQDDRPYAAWLYLGFSAHFKSKLHSHSLEFDVGVIGPEAGGQNFQNGYHKMVATYLAEGWRNQLSTEPTVQLSYQQRLKFFDFQNMKGVKYFDIIPFYGGGFGNVAIDAHAGGILRLGTNLPSDFGPTRPSLMDGDNFVTPIVEGYPATSFYVFVAGRGIAVARNIFLDGNTFRQSHRVRKYPFFIETEFGAVGIFKEWSTVWRFVTRSPEFEQRSAVNSFASLSITYAF